MFNPLNPNLIKLPKDLDAVTDIGKEASPGSVGVSEQDIEKLWGKTRDLYKTRFSPGVSIAIRHKGELILDRAIGHAKGNAPGEKGAVKVPMTTDTPVCLFSASKAITAMLVHQMASEGLIKLHHPVAEYIPEFGVKGKQYTTVGHILSHRGGIPTIKQKVPDPSVLWDWDGVIDILCNARPRKDAGTAQAYHAITGGYILGEIMRRVTGQDLKDIYRERLQKPLGAKFMTLGLPEEHRATAADNVFTGYSEPFPVDRIVKNALGGSFDMVCDVSNSPDFLDANIPAGNVYATASECADFFQVLLDSGRLDNIDSAPLKKNGKQSKPMFDSVAVTRAINEASPRQFDRTLMIPLRTSEGFMLGDSPFGMYGPHTSSAFGHLGFINIFCWADPSRDISVSILTTGKCLFGPHMPALVKLLVAINKTFPVLD